MIVILAVATVIIASVVWKVTHPTVGEGSRYGKHGGISIPVPITMQTVGTTNFPIFLDGLGTVQALSLIHI